MPVIINTTANKLKTLDKTGATDTTSVTGVGMAELLVEAGTVSVSVDGGIAVSYSAGDRVTLGFNTSLSVTPGTGAKYSVVLVYQ